MKNNFWKACTFISIIFSSVAVAQTPADQAPDSHPPDVTVRNTSCNAFAIQSAARLTLKQRTCYLVRPLLSPQMAISIAAMAAFDQYRNSPREPHERWSKFPHRIEIHYARAAARDSGELLVGYLHHEDPRLRSSGVGGIWRRANSAFLRVITSPSDDGRLRPAFAPVAGSLSSAFVGTLMYRHSETLPCTFTKAAVVYSFYFVRAVFGEFKPEMDGLIRRVLN